MSTSNGLCYKLYYYESRIMVLAERLQVECQETKITFTTGERHDSELCATKHEAAFKLMLVNSITSGQDCLKTQRLHRNEGTSQRALVAETGALLQEPVVYTWSHGSRPV